MKVYADDYSWLEIQKHLPFNNRITEKIYPQEKYDTYNSINIHIDEYKRASDISIVILHGVGGNGRLVSFIAVPLARRGYNVICPDLPGYGYTQYKSKTKIDYQTWIDVGSYIVENELKRKHKVFVLGLSAGGMLGYNVCCCKSEVAGLVVTNILDSREQAVRNYSAKNSLQAKYGIKILSALPAFIKAIKVPIRMVTNMEGLVNKSEILKILLKDKRGAGSNVQIDFLLSMMNYSPLIDPESFKTPTLMVHPEKDLWTPVEVSDLFFSRIKTEKVRVILEGCGHFPVEEPGITQLEREIIDFIDKNA